LGVRRRRSEGGSARQQPSDPKTGGRRNHCTPVEKDT
jgi:hypothetical protein